MHWCREVQHLRLRAAFYIMPLFYLRTCTFTRQWKSTLTENITVESRTSWGKENGFEWPLCEITSDKFRHQAPFVS